MARWESRPGLPDLPRGGQVEPFRSGGGNPFVLPATDGPPRGSNPQSVTPGFTDARRKRVAWLRNNIGALAGSGTMPDRADFEHLPESHRARAREMAVRAVEEFKSGEQAQAADHIIEDLMTLESEIGHAWRPPKAERPSAELLDEIQHKPAIR